MPDSIKIRRALISVYDKTGIVEFARALRDEFGIEIISTGGTAKTLIQADIPVMLVEEITGFPEMMDGRVKTLHPKIHAAILADRDNHDHMRQLAEQGIEPIDMVVVNLYPFEKTIARPDCTFEEAIEMIDIGGPCLLRAAAKNHRGVLIVSDPILYDIALIVVKEGSAGAADLRRKILAFNAFARTTGYDGKVAAWLSKPGSSESATFRSLQFNQGQETSYGENPHQRGAALNAWEAFGARGLVGVAREDGAPGMSFNNYADASAAMELCAELTRGGAREEPRASARAVPSKQKRTDCSIPFQEPDPSEPAWLLTWTTYGSWLPGDERGFVSRVPTDARKHEIHNIPGTPYDADQRELEESAKERMGGKPVILSEAQAKTALAALAKVATTHHISVIASSIMSNHVHVLCQGEQDGVEMMRLFKGVSARRMSQSHTLPDAPRWWTKSGSRRYIQRGSELGAAVSYVCEQEGALYAGSFREAARAEARGSSLVPKQRRYWHCTCCFIKHTNACGTAVDTDPVEAYRKAYLGDPNAAMGGILAVNFDVDAEFAEAVMETYQRWGKPAGAGGFFVEVWLAPSFDAEAVRIIRGEVEGKPRKAWGKRVRLLDVGDMSVEPDPDEMDLKRIAGGLLMQSRDLVGLNEEQWNVVTQRQPTDAEMTDLRLAWLVCKHTKSNAITICKDGTLIGNGAGQMSRVMSGRIATWLARENGHEDELKGAVAASDAFFPFRDGPDALVDAGVTAIIQPGGSKRDEEVIAACNERGVAMILTGTRHFRH